MNGRQPPTRVDEDLDALADALVYAAQALVGVSVRALSGHEEVTLPQLRVLVVLETRGPQRLGGLAEILGVGPSGATRLCDRLEAKGLVRRSESSEDRRVTFLHLTAAGARLVRRYAQRRRSLLEEVIRAVPAEQRPGLLEALEALRKAIGEPRPAVEGAGFGPAGLARARPR